VASDNGEKEGKSGKIRESTAELRSTNIQDVVSVSFSFFLLSVTHLFVYLLIQGKR
jgi:hypothetical protein